MSGVDLEDCEDHEASLVEAERARREEDEVHASQAADREEDQEDFDHGDGLANLERTVDSLTRRATELRRIVREYRQLRHCGVLLTHGAAGRILDVHTSRAQSLVKEGHLTQVYYPALGIMGVTLTSVDAYRLLRKSLGMGDSVSALQWTLKELQEKKHELETERLSRK